MKAKTQKQKKINSTLFIVAMILFAAVLVSSAFVAGTFAKYTTTGNGTDSASVATWGITFDAEAVEDSLFTNKYEDSNHNKIVFISDNQDVVAPGTNGGINVAVKGTSTVAFRVKVGYTITYGDGWNTTTPTDISNYRPITWTSGTTNMTATSADGLVYTSGTLVQDYVAGTDFGETGTDFGLAWNWAFYVNDATDVLDTTVAGLSDTDISVLYTITVEQIQAITYTTATVI